MSTKGKVLNDLVTSHSLNLINCSSKCNGTFTRINNKNITEKSILDYFIVNLGLLMTK